MPEGLLLYATTITKELQGHLCASFSINKPCCMSLLASKLSLKGVISIFEIHKQL